MSALSEEDLLRMAQTGQPPLSPSFDHEKSLGNQAFKQNRLEDAIRHYTNAEQINPLSPIPPANRAMAYLKLHHWQAAKADATIALDLYHALSHSPQDQTLLIKILLRRATANSSLLLHSLAADDYASILALDPAHPVAKTRLHQLQRDFAVHPSPSASPTNQPSHQPTKKIHLLSVNSSPSTTAPPHSPATQPNHPRTLHDASSLMPLPSNLMRPLLNKCTAVPPASSVHFEQAWRSLHSDSRARARYLVHTVGAARIRNGLLGQTLTPQLFNDFIHVLLCAVDTDPASTPSVADLLDALTAVSRFEILLMFLSDTEKESIHLLIQQLGRNGLDPNSVRKLQIIYS